MRAIEVATFRELTLRAVEVLEASVSQRAPLHAVMLAGGTTPYGAYAALARRRPRVDPGLRIILSDERQVPEDSPDSNYGRMRSMLAALALPPARVLRPDPGREPAASARRFGRELASFFARRGTLSLALLGLGEDGHTASIYDRAGVARHRDGWAMAVRRPVGPARVSVTAAVLRRAERIVFLAAGEGKRGVVRQLMERPESVTAGWAVQGCRKVEIWYCSEPPSPLQ